MAATAVESGEGKDAQRAQAMPAPYFCGERFCECCGDCVACYGEDCAEHGCARCSAEVAEAAP